MNYIWSQISYSSPYISTFQKQRFACVKKNLVKLQEDIFKAQKMLAHQQGGYISAIKIEWVHVAIECSE